MLLPNLLILRHLTLDGFLIQQSEAAIAYSSCNIQLIHYINAIPITGLCMLTDMLLCIASHGEEIRGLKPAQACSSLQSPFSWLLCFYNLCWADPCAGLAGS